MKVCAFVTNKFSFLWVIVLGEGIHTNAK